MSALLEKKYTVLYLAVNLTIGIWFVSLALQYPEGPALFPTIMGWGLISTTVIHSGIELARTRRLSAVSFAGDTDKKTDQNEKFGWWQIILPAAIFAFIFSVPYLGLYPAIAIFLLITLPISGQKTWYVVILTTISVLLGTYLVFDYLLGVPLPSGNIF